MNDSTSDRKLPAIIQGGMGIGVSTYRLANAVSRRGALGVVSGTALDTVFVRRLQLGDPTGDMRRALLRFPWPDVSNRILKEYFIEGGKQREAPFRLLAMPSLNMNRERLQVLVAANFVEVFLAKDGHSGMVGINFLEKIQLPTLASLYGALVAGVDVVLMGAGIPTSIPGAIEKLSRSEPTELRISVSENPERHEFSIQFDPATLFSEVKLQLKTPRFLAIVSSHVIAKTLQRKANGPVAGFIVENHTAGGHNAPPRRQGRTRDQPYGFGPADEPDLEAFRELGAPFWLAGGTASPEGLKTARIAGAQGVQLGTIFAFCEESSILSEIKQDVIERVSRGTIRVTTDFEASPTGYPFKIVHREGEGESKEVVRLRTRERVCDLGYLRQPYCKHGSDIGFRCPAEPATTYVKKGGAAEDTVNKLCLCNQLLATVGLGQVRDTGGELPVLTAGEDLLQLLRVLKPASTSYTAGDALDFIMGVSTAP